jgi:hypothetical protein
MGLAQSNGIDHGVIVEVTAQWAKQIPEVGLGEGIAKTVRKGQQPSAGLQKT